MNTRIPTEDEPVLSTDPVIDEEEIRFVEEFTREHPEHLEYGSTGYGMPMGLEPPQHTATSPRDDEEGYKVMERTEDVSEQMPVDLDRS